MKSLEVDVYGQFQNFGKIIISKRILQLFSNYKNGVEKIQLLVEL